MNSLLSEVPFFAENDLNQSRHIKSDISDVSSTIRSLARIPPPHPDGTTTHAEEGCVPRHFPFTTRPFPFPASFHYRGIALVPIINKLISRVASDHDFLERKMAPVAKADPEFIGRLLKILRSCHGKEEPIETNIMRTDYLAHDRYGANDMAMVEINVVSPGSFMHMSVVQDFQQPVTQQSKTKAQMTASIECEVVDALALAHRTYKEMNQTPEGLHAVIAIVADSHGEMQSEFDSIRPQLEERCDCACTQFSLRDICEYGRLLNGQLLMKLPGWKSEKVISVAYLRSGFTAFPNFVEQQWTGRTMLEHSNAVKCPTVAAQLVGSKRMQQVLTSEETLRQYLDSKEEVDLLKSTFVRHYSLCKSEGGVQHAKMAMQSPRKFVMKGQDDGVGSVYFSEEMRSMLTQHSEDELEAYTLMDRLIVDKSWCSVVKHGKMVEEEVIGELAIWSTYVSCNGEEVLNKYAGMGARLKSVDEEEHAIVPDTGIFSSVVFAEHDRGEE